MAKPAFEFTICMTEDPEKIAVKRITPTETIQYDKVFLWRFKPTVENSLEAMAERLRALALKPRRMIVMGAPLPSLDLSLPHRRTWREQSVATLAAPPRWWLPIDLDDAVVPKGLGSAERLTEAALFVRDQLLPDEFYGARMIVVPSASTGRKGDSTARLRLFALLASPHSLTAMKDWAKGAAATLGLPIDSAPIQAGQPIYTARPIFEGMEDPVPRALHAQVLDGDQDCRHLRGRASSERSAARRASRKAAIVVCQTLSEVSPARTEANWWCSFSTSCGGRPKRRSQNAAEAQMRASSVGLKAWPV